MSTSTAIVRAAGKTILVGLLAVLVFTSALLAGNSSLHHLLHSDHGSPSHFCLVSLLDHSHTPVPEMPSQALSPGNLFVVRWLPCDVAFSSIDSSMLSGRGPPCPA